MCQFFYKRANKFMQVHSLSTKFENSFTWKNTILDEICLLIKRINNLTLRQPLTEQIAYNSTTLAVQLIVLN